MTSPNLAAPHVAASQTQKEVTINDATDALDLALTASLSLDCSAGGTVSVTTSQAQRHVRLALTGTPAAAFNLQLPAVPRILAVANGTSVTATVKNATGATAEVPAAKQALVHTSGTGVSLVGASLTDSVYDFGMTALATPAAGALLGKVVLPRAVTLPPNFAGARGHVDVPPTANVDLTVTRNGTAIGTVTIATSGAVSFATSGGTAIALAAGDVVRFIAPGTADPTLSGIALTLSNTVTFAIEDWLATRYGIL